MKSINITTGTVGLVYRKGAYERVITKGQHRLGWGRTVQLFNTSQAVDFGVELNSLLEDAELAALLHVIMVADNELVIQYENGNYKGVLKAGRHVFWKGINELTFSTINLSELEVSESIDRMTLKRAEVKPYVRVCRVGTHENGVLFINNKAERILEAGDYYFWKNATEVGVATVDLRQQQLEVSGQEILTRDKAALRINFYTQYQVVNITKAVNA